ncbi:MAG: methyltransferase domain-containing protein [Isosphaeraceae bacterium]
MELEPAEVFRVHHVPLLFESAAAHLWMVYDARRVGRFRRAIQETVIQGDVVVDLGTGMGLLAFLCARAGARRVHAIERNPVILEWAERLARANGLAERVMFHYGDSREVEGCELGVRVSREPG